MYNTSLAQREPQRKLKANFSNKHYQNHRKCLHKLKTYRECLFCTSFSLYWSNWKFKKRLYRLPFGFFHLNVSKIVDSSKLNKSREHKGKANRYEPVHGSSIGYFWQWMSCTDAQCRHCQHCGYSLKKNKANELLNQSKTKQELASSFKQRILNHLWVFLCLLWMLH